MKKLTLGQLRSLLEAAERRLKEQPNDPTLRRAVQKLQDGIRYAERGEVPK